jgi:hypothetical protein
MKTLRSCSLPKARMRASSGLRSLRRTGGVLPNSTAMVVESAFESSSSNPQNLPTSTQLASFPEGIYSFSGKTVTGDCLKGSASLSHEIVPATVLLTPSEEEIVPIDKLVLSWQAVAGVERYVVELNNENSGSEFTFDVFPPTTSVAIPAHFLQPDSEYQFAVGVKTANGNVTFVELTFFYRTLSPRGWRQA